jgi:type IV secretion system protein VirD4
MRGEERVSAANAPAASAPAFAQAGSNAACRLTLPGSPATNLEGAILALPRFIAESGPFSPGAAPVAAGAVACCAVWLAWARGLTRRTPDRAGEEHGSAKWGSLREGRRFMDLSHPGANIILTEHLGMALERTDHDRRYERNRNVLVVGGSGSGKTRGYVEPNIMQMNADLFVTDPKGETLPMVGGMLQAHGYDIRCLNMVDMSQLCLVNPSFRK